MYQQTPNDGTSSAINLPSTCQIKRHVDAPRKVVDRIKEKLWNSKRTDLAQSTSAKGDGIPAEGPAQSKVVPDETLKETDIEAKEGIVPNNNRRREILAEHDEKSFGLNRGSSSPEFFLGNQRRSSTLVERSDDLQWMDQIPTEYVESSKRLPLRRIKDTVGDYFTVLVTLGTGSFGRVYLVQDREGNFSAMKRYKKQALIAMKQCRQIKRETTILASLKHPFIVNLQKSFMDRRYIYMLLDFVPGGELFFHVRASGKLKEREACFYASQVVSIFEYLHQFRVVYRDLKPENLLIDEKGYLKLADFGFAKVVTDKTNTMCGTPDYLAPEILLKKGHNRAVDWWTLGILVYEMMYGKSPFGGDDSSVNELYARILYDDIVWDKEIFTPHMKDVISRLLEREPEKRLGSGPSGLRDVKSHSWFTGLDWNILLQRKYKPPFVPELNSPCDTRYFDSFDEDTDDGESIPMISDPFRDFDPVDS